MILLMAMRHSSPGAIFGLMIILVIGALAWHAAKSVFDKMKEKIKTRGKKPPGDGE